VTGRVDISPHAHPKVLFYKRLDSVPVIFKYVLRICLIIVQWQQKNIFGIAANRPRYPALIELNRVYGQPLIKEFRELVNQVKIFTVLERCTGKVRKDKLIDGLKVATYVNWARGMNIFHTVVLNVYHFVRRG
jgi:hypothetical protein